MLGCRASWENKTYADEFFSRRKFSNLGEVRGRGVIRGRCLIEGAGALIYFFPNPRQISSVTL